MTAHAQPFDPQTGEVLPHPASTVPRAALDHANAEIEYLKTELKAVTTERNNNMRSAANHKIRAEAYQDEIAGFLDGWSCQGCGVQGPPVANRDTVLGILRYMAEKSGRDGTTERSKLQIGMSSSAALWVKKMLAHEKTPREVCTAWLGMLTSDWHMRKPDVRCHPKFLCTVSGDWDDATFDRHFDAGRRVLEIEARRRLALRERETA